MEEVRSTFEQVFIYLYYLMLSADRIADLNELKLGSKIIKLEKLDKTAIMNKIDVLTSISREKIFDDGQAFLKTLDKEEQLKCLAYIKLISKTDGSVHTKEIDLINSLSSNELKISLADISKKEKELESLISEFSDQEA